MDLDSSSKFLLSGGADKKIALWNVKDLKLEKYFIGHFSAILSLKFIYRDKMFISGSADRSVRVWNINKNQLTRIIMADIFVDSIFKLGEINYNVVLLARNKFLKFRVLGC